MPINVAYGLERHPLRNDPVWCVRVAGKGPAGSSYPFLYIASSGTYLFSGPPKEMYSLRMAVTIYHERLERDQDPELCRMVPGAGVSLNPVLVGEPYCLDAPNDHTYRPPNPFGTAYFQNAVLPQNIEAYKTSYLRLLAEEIEAAAY